MSEAAVAAPTAEHRRLIRLGDPLTFPASDPCPLKVGDVWTVKAAKAAEGAVPIVSISVTAIRRSKDAAWWVVEYRTADHRPRLLRRALPRHGLDTDEDGRPRQPTAEAIKRAAEDSAYTSSERAAILDAGEAVPPEVQRRFTLEARRRDAERLRAEDVMRQQARSIAENTKSMMRLCARNGVDATPVLAQINRLIQSQIEEVEDAA